MDLPQNLKHFRVKNNFSQGDLAEKLNVSRQAVSRWETGKTQPDLETIKIIAELYGVTIDELLGVHTDDGKKSLLLDFETIEPLMYMVCLALTAQLPPLGIIMSMYILIKYNKKHSKFLKILSIICLLFCLYQTGVFIHYMTFEGSGTVEPL